MWVRAADGVRLQIPGARIRSSLMHVEGESQISSGHRLISLSRALEGEGEREEVVVSRSCMCERYYV